MTAMHRRRRPPKTSENTSVEKAADRRLEVQQDVERLGGDKWSVAYCSTGSDKA